MISNPLSDTAPPSPEQRTPGDPLEYISASRLKCYQTCGLQYYFRYVEKLPSESSRALLVGSAVHGVLQAWNLARWRGEDASAEKMQLVFDDEWAQQCEEEEFIWKDDTQEGKEKAKAWNILDHYLAHSPIPLNERPEAVEVRVERDLAAYGLPPLLGFIDLVRKGGCIVDFKTSARSPGTPQSVLHQNEVQLGIYALLYREATGNQESGSEIHTLVKTKEPKLIVTPIGAMQPDQIRRGIDIKLEQIRLFRPLPR